MKWFLTHWPILTFVFASGGAFAWQEVQRQTLADVVIEQHDQAKQQRKYNEAIIKLQVQQTGMKQYQQDIRKKLDFLIQLQLKGSNL
jgi:hypothetical protein